MQVTLKVLQAGPSVSVQDQGRPGHLRFGVTGSGAMDRTAFAIANAALDNPTSNPALEISLGGITLECSEGSVSIAIAGGSFTSLLNDEKLPLWSVFTMNAGDILKVRPGEWGSWCYIAFAGQIEAEQWLNSYSVHLNSGVCGRPLQADDSFNIIDASATVKQTSMIAEAKNLAPKHEIRVVIGPQDRFFEPDTIEKLLDTEFTISAEYDRMGMRLNGYTIPISASLDMPSEPISRGSLQVPGHGDPICLMADHHTAGGYPKIATVISADQDALAQHRSGDKISFVSCTPLTAAQTARDRAEQIEALFQEAEQNKISLTERLWTSNLISGAASAQD